MDDYQYSDKELIKLYRDTKRDEYFNMLYLRYYKMKQYTLKNYKSLSVEIEAMFDDCFMIAVNKFDLEIESYKFSAYLKTVISSKYNNIYKHDKNTSKMYVDNIISNKGDEEISIFSVLADLDINIEKDYMDDKSLQLLVKYIHRNIEIFIKNKKNKDNTEYIIVNVLFNNKKYKDIANDINYSENQVGKIYREFIAKLKRSITHRYKQYVKGEYYL